MGIYINDEVYRQAASECLARNQYTTAPNAQTAQSANNSSIFNEGGYVSDKGNKCTDGKDDGKIGGWGVIGNLLEGAGKSLVNGIKGMFIDPSTGKFSLGRTLLTVGVGALCVAFPAVGVGLCAVGAVSGAVNIGKGAIKASQATTDAEAKDAWEQIGDGTFTAVTSAVGAKASFKAMKGTSTAGINAKQIATDAKGKITSNSDVYALNHLGKSGVTNADDVMRAIDRGDDMADVAKIMKFDKGTRKAALDNLGDMSDLSTLQKAGKYGKAFLQDAKSSTKNQAISLKNTAVTLKNKHNLDKANKELTKANAKNAKAKPDDTKIDITKLEEKVAKAQEAYDNSKTTKTSDAIIKGEEKLAERKSNKTAAQEKVEQAKNAWKEAQKTDDQVKIDAAKEAYDAAKKEASTLEKAKATIEQKKQSILENAKNADDVKTAQATFDEASKNSKGLFSKIFGENGKNYRQAAKNLKSVKRTAYLDAMSKLPKKGQAIIEALKNENASYNKVIQEYGYNDVTEALKTFYTYQVASNSL